MSEKCTNDIKRRIGLVSSIVNKFIRICKWTNKKDSDNETNILTF